MMIIFDQYGADICDKYVDMYKSFRLSSDVSLEVHDIVSTAC